MATTIAPNDANILYSPYTWDVTSARAKTILSGSYFKVYFSAAASDLVINLDLTGLVSPYSVISYRVDKGAWIKQRITAATINVTLSSYWPSHILEFIINTSASNDFANPTGGAQFTGLSSSGTLTTRPITARKLKGLALGDSLSVGVLATTTSANVPDTSVDPYSPNDAKLGWAYPLRELLGVEIGIHGFPGSGLTPQGSIPTPAQFWYQLWQGKNMAASGADMPNFIIMNMGTNDGGSTDASVTAAVVALLNQWTSYFTCQIFLIRPAIGTKASAVLAAIAQSNYPLRVTWIDTTGLQSGSDTSDGTHPYGYVNTDILSPFIANAMSTWLQGNKTQVWNGSAWVGTVA